jgi:predicted ATPase
LVETFGGTDRKWSVELLSDGTLRVLAIAAALLTVPEGATVVIEEVDNGVHPSRAKLLLKTMREQAVKRHIRLLLSSHNPALMDALPDEAIGDVVFCYRDPEKGDSRLSRLSDITDYANLVSQGPLGELVTNGIVDRFIKSPVTPEMKKHKALEWLSVMQGDEA